MSCFPAIPDRADAAHRRAGHRERSPAFACGVRNREQSDRLIDWTLDPFGRMDIVTQGRERFELLQVNQERTFLRGEVLYLTDEPERPTREEVAHAVELHRQILALAHAAQDLPESEDPPLSYHLAGSLPLDLDFKQKMLGIRSEAERLRSLIAYFEALLPNLRRAVHIRKKAGGNGHAR